MVRRTMGKWLGWLPRLALIGELVAFDGLYFLLEKYEQEI